MSKSRDQCVGKLKDGRSCAATGSEKVNGKRQAGQSSPTMLSLV